ncbi:MAG: gliding motility-associated C-terminal domain-containing protein, partial [Bacteroidia bacterium]|nr:gliding motility-associated C-terminal domain-containing protein [Bacteroidia bacterium]
ATLSKYLGVINQPNVKGAGCNFKENQVDLKNKIAYNGLPSIINDLSYDPFNGFNHSIIDSCPGTVQFNGFSAMAGMLQWHWEFGDGTTADIQNPIHTFNPPNQPFTVLLRITSSTGCGDGTIYRSKIIKPQGVISQVDFDFISDCKADDVIFINKTPFSEDSAGLFTWDFGDGTISNEINPVHTYTFKDTFTVKLKMKTSIFCLDDSISHDINLMLFQVKASPYQTIFVGQTAKLDVTPGGQTYQWTPTIWLNNPNIKSPSAQPLDDITYKVTVTNKDGCISQDSIFIKVLQLTDFYVPSGFTPNNDGKNDKIRPLFGNDFTLEEFSILNRWGQTVYITHTRDDGWDGKVGNVPQNPAVFVWIIKAVSRSGIHYQKKGTFALIR